MFIGLITTIFLIPPTRGPDEKPLTLEALAAENGHPENKLNQIWRGNGRQNGVVGNEGMYEEEEGRGTRRFLSMEEEAMRSNGRNTEQGEFEMNQIVTSHGLLNGT